MAKHLHDSTNITILAAISLDVERTAPSSTFHDEIGCVKFISVSKATKEKRLHFTLIIEFTSLCYDT